MSMKRVRSGNKIERSLNGYGRTVWHSAGRERTTTSLQKATISRAKRSAAMPGWAATFNIDLQLRCTIWLDIPLCRRMCIARASIL
jgi:hypothetical protein